MSVRRRLQLLQRLVRRRPAVAVPLVQSATDYALERERPKGLPLFLQIEPTILCNLECKFCINPFLPRTRTSLTLDRFRRIADQVPTLAKISLVGIGESFMNRELWTIVREAKARGIEIGTTSNGTILTERILAEILESGLDWLNFSLDGATKATYERMRPGARFEAVLENIRRVAVAVGTRPRPKLAVWFLATRENVAELPDVVEVVRGLGLRELHTQGVHYWGHADWQEGARRANAIDDLHAVLRRTREAAARARVRFQWHNFPERGAARECRWPWRGAYITADGYVTPCCENGSDPNRINFGNVLEQPFDEIWTSPAYGQFRRELKSASGRPSICVDCPSYERNVRLGP